MPDLADMPRFQSIKQVRAGRIKRVETARAPNVVVVDLGGRDELRVAAPDGLFARYMAQPGDYLVQYPRDGYLAISPKAAFETGYEPIADRTTDG